VRGGNGWSSVIDDVTCCSICYSLSTKIIDVFVLALETLIKVRQIAYSLVLLFDCNLYIFIKHYIFSVIYSYLQNILCFTIQFVVIIHLCIPPLNQLTYILYISYNYNSIIYLIMHTYVFSCLYVTRWLKVTSLLIYNILLYNRHLLFLLLNNNTININCQSQFLKNQIIYFFSFLLSFSPFFLPILFLSSRFSLLHPTPYQRGNTQWTSVKRWTA
jgi:hypothetical protein